MPARFNTRYPGVLYRTARRTGGTGEERVYYIRFYKDGKKYEEKVGRQYADGLTPARAARIRGERIEGRRPSRREKIQAESLRWTILKLWEEYKSRNPELKGIVQDQNRFDNYLKASFGRKTPGEITPFDVDSMRVRLLRSKKPATVRNILELLRRLAMFGANKQLCKNLDFRIEMPRVNNEKTEDLTPEQLANLLETLEMDEYKILPAASMMRLALFTGMRRGEMFHLKWTDVDWRREFISIRNPKGGVDQSIPMSRATKDVLQSIKRTKSPYVFPGKSGGMLTDVKNQVRKIRKKAGLPKDFRGLHGLRHVYASMLASSGQVDMYTLQKLLTHKSPQMTQRYAHLRDEALKAGAAVADELLFPDAKSA